MDRLERRLLGKRESAILKSKEDKAKQDDEAEKKHRQTMALGGT